MWSEKYFESQDIESLLTEFLWEAGTSKGETNFLKMRLNDILKNFLIKIKFLGGENVRFVFPSERP